jgi:UDP-N-acetylmuramoyl-L-alanyl-D-glutamate--2,6-diaminopimelate ligase
VVNAVVEYSAVDASDAGAGCGYETSLAALLEGIAHPLRDVPVLDLTEDSRSATPGSAFIACQGRSHHGLEFVGEAVAKGATVILWEPAPGVAEPVLPTTAAVHAIPELRRLVGRLADRFFRSPSSQLRLAGITGTNGKTTSAYLLAQASEFVGKRSAYLGTIGFGRPGAVVAAGMTTPDCVTLHRRIAEARDDDAETMALEISSHALDQDRHAGVSFDTAVFTNLSRDHLEYHGTLDAYGAAKAKLFHAEGLQRCVINQRDPFGQRLAEELGSAVEQVLYTTSNDLWVPPGAGWIRVPELRATATGLTLHIESSWGAGTLKSRLAGEYNAENLLAALGVLLGWGVPLQTALVALAGCAAPPGRMEPFGGGAQPRVFVDYAHTPDALARLLDAARAHTRGRLFCVFGCGGERDPGKRPQMGAIAERGADVVVLTDDNPRGEDSTSILEQIQAGMRDPGAAQVIANRRDAIHYAISEADAADVVVIAGKGHETEQVVGTEARPFSDAGVVQDALGAEA